MSSTFVFVGERFSIPSQLAATAIEEIGFSVLFTRTLESKRVLRLEDLANVDLDLLFAQDSAAARQMEMLIDALRNHISVGHSDAPN